MSDAVLFGRKKKPTAATGDCYEAAVRFVKEACLGQDPDLCPYLIVQAEVRGQGALEGKTFGHAWVVDPRTNTVIDRSNGRDLRLPLSLYYAIGGVYDLDNGYEYTWREAMVWMLRTKHYGPWELVTRSGL